MTDDDSRARDEDAPDAEPKRSYPDYLLRHGRERGLSKADRRYLAAEDETIDNKGTEINTRTRIRERIRESIVDFWLLTEYLDDHDRDLIFKESDERWDNWELQIGLKSAIQFFYAALDETPLVDFETVLISGIHDAENKQRDSPVQVDVDFDVEVDEQFSVEEAYQRFQRGVPLSPEEIGALLLTGKVRDPTTIQRLSYHARSNSFIDYALSPLLSEQLSSISDREERIERFRYHWSHLPHEYAPMEAGIALPHSIPDFYYLREELAFQRDENKDATSEDLANGESAEESAGGGSTEGESDEGDSTSHEVILRELSVDLDEPITVGDAVVYEDGDRHSLGGAGGDGGGADSPADADGTTDGADDADGSR